MPFSYSQMSAWLQCPAMYKFRKDRVPEDPMVNELMQTGKFAHAVYEEYARHCVANSVQTDVDELESIAHAVRTRTGFPYAMFRGAVEELILPFGESHLFDLNAIASYEEQIAITPDGQPVEWESELAWFRAVLDLLEFPSDNTARVTDYKTGFSTQADPMQMEVYAWLLFLLYPSVESVECVFDYTRFNLRRSKEFTREDVNVLAAQVREVTGMIAEDTTFDARPGPHCEWCSWKSSCKYKPIIPGELTSKSDAVALANAVSFKARELKDLRARLKEWCDLNGPVAGNGCAWGNFASESWSFDPQEFLAAAIQDQVDPWKYLSVNGTKARSLKKKGQFVGAIGEVAIREVKVKFGMKKVDGEEVE